MDWTNKFEWLFWTDFDWWSTQNMLFGVFIYIIALIAVCVCVCVCDVSGEDVGHMFSWWNYSQTKHLFSVIGLFIKQKLYLVRGALDVRRFTSFDIDTRQASVFLFELLISAYPAYNNNIDIHTNTIHNERISKLLMPISDRLMSFMFGLSSPFCQQSIWYGRWSFIRLGEGVRLCLYVCVLFPNTLIVATFLGSCFIEHFRFFFFTYVCSIYSARGSIRFGSIFASRGLLMCHGWKKNSHTAK